jgi:hypothetical protein
MPRCVPSEAAGGFPLKTVWKTILGLAIIYDSHVMADIYTSRTPRLRKPALFHFLCGEPPVFVRFLWFSALPFDTKITFPFVAVRPYGIFSARYRRRTSFVIELRTRSTVQITA